MITAISIRNFKGFKDTEINGLAPVTLIGGKNNSGKSSLLEAMFMLYSVYNHDNFNRQFAMRGAGNLYSDAVESWSTLFHDRNIDSAMRLQAETERERYTLEYAIDQYAVPKLTNNQIPNEILNQIGALQNNFHIEGALKLKFFVNGNPVYESEQFSNGYGQARLMENKKVMMSAVTMIPAGGTRSLNAQVLTQLDINNQLDIVLDALRIIEPSIRNISIVPLERRQNVMLNGVSSIQVVTDAEVYVDIGLSKKMPLKLMGDGMVHLVNFIISIVNSKNGIVLIDEIENGIHYSVRKDLWGKIAKIAHELKCQIVATTHSYECLQSAAEALGDNDFSYIRLETKDHRNVTGVAYTAEELRMALNWNMEVR